MRTLLKVGLFAPAPDVRIPPSVKTGDHDHLAIDDSVVEAVGEAFQEDAAGFSVHDRVALGILMNGLYRDPHSGQEILAEPGTSGLVPTVGLLDVRCRLRAEDGQDHRLDFLIRWNTSSQGMPRAPSRSRSSSLRSSSSSCAAVSGRASGLRERLSQISSRSFNCSSMVISLTLKTALAIPRVSHRDRPLARLHSRSALNWIGEEAESSCRTYQPQN